MDRDTALFNLRYVGGDENTSLEGWRRLTRRKINVVKDSLLPYASHESSLADKDAPPLSFVYSLFSVLCILISEEYDAALNAIVANNPAPLASLLPVGTPIASVFRAAYSIAENLRLEWENAAKNKRLKPVRVLTPYEMKLRLEYQEKIPHTLPPRKRLSVIDWPALQRTVWGNLFLSIDPFTPPEVAGEIVKSMLRDFQTEKAKETIESWDAELKAGVIEKDFPSRDAEFEQLRFDFRRAFAGNKKTRGEGTTFEMWLRRLEVYDLHRQGLTPREIAKRIKHFNDDRGFAVKISQDKAQAQAMIEAALSGIPVAAVVNVRAGKI